MTKRKHNYYRMSKVIIFTAMILSTLCFTTYPESNAKYFTAEEDVLVYNASLYKLSSDEDIKITMSTNPNYKSDSENAYFEFSFDRNKPEIIKGAETDVYSITVPKAADGTKACEFVSVTSSNKLTEADGRVYNNKYTITYKNTDEPDTNKIVMKCSVAGITKTNGNGRYLSVSVTVREKINDEDKFIYKESNTFNQVLSDYEETVNPEFTLSKTFNQDDANNYDEFIDWIMEYSNRYAKERAAKYLESHPNEVVLESDFNYSGALLTYVKNAYPDEASLYQNKLNGLTIQHEEGSKEYTFIIEGNFVGYARTDVSPNSISYPKLYFSTISGRDFTLVDKQEVEDNFAFYLKTYVYPNDETAYNEVMNFVNLEGGIYSYIVNSNKEINGFSYNEKEKYVELNLLPLLDYAYNRNNNNDTIKNGMIRVGKRPLSMAMYPTFLNNLSVVYDESIISSKAITELFNEDVNNSLNNGSMYSEIAASIKNTTNQPFDNYFIAYDSVNNHYLLINVFSDGEKYNWVKINVLDYNPENDVLDEEKIEKPNIEFTNDSSNNKLELKITYRTEAQLDNVVSELEKYFKLDSLGDSTLESGEDVQVITYSIDKNNLKVIGEG